MRCQGESRGTPISIFRSPQVKAVRLSWPVHSLLRCWYVHIHMTSVREVAETGGRDETRPGSPGKRGRQDRRAGDGIAGASG